MSEAIIAENLCFGYQKQTRILKDVSFQLAHGGFLSIVGPNGAGKTTLLNLISGLLKPVSGSIKISEALLRFYSIKALARKIAVVRQEFAPVFDFSVRQVVSMARTPYLGAIAFEAEADNQAIEDALEMTGTAPFAGRPLNQLSGGERQLVFIARALAQQTPILLLDEPTSFLDIKHQVDIYDLLKKMQLEKQKTIVAVSHDINLAAQYSDTVLLLEAGAGFAFGPTKEILSVERIESVFGVKTFSVQTGQNKFFFPLGKYIKDNFGLQNPAE
jgi:iron complex transport system ATP-binding protein